MNELFLALFFYGGIIALLNFSLNLTYIKYDVLNFLVFIYFSLGINLNIILNEIYHITPFKNLFIFFIGGIINIITHYLFSYKKGYFLSIISFILFIAFMFMFYNINLWLWKNLYIYRTSSSGTIYGFLFKYHFYYTYDYDFLIPTSILLFIILMLLIYDKYDIGIKIQKLNSYSTFYFW